MGRQRIRASMSSIEREIRGVRKTRERMEKKGEGGRKEGGRGRRSGRVKQRQRNRQSAPNVWIV